RSPDRSSPRGPANRSRGARVREGGRGGRSRRFAPERKSFPAWRARGGAPAPRDRAPRGETRGSLPYRLAPVANRHPGLPHEEVPGEEAVLQVVVALES